MTAGTLIAQLNQCQNRTIVVVGDVMLDEYHWCKVTRLSPEAPVPICSVESTTLVPGGAANVANNLIHLGATVMLVGVIGEDSSGDKLIHALSDNGITTTHMVRVKSRPTILKSRIIAHHQHVVRVDREDISPISIKIQNKLMATLDPLWQSMHALVISDYLKGTLPDRFVQWMITRARSYQIPVIIDPKGTSYKKYKHASILTPNYSEFIAAIGKTPENESEIFKEGKKLKDRLKLDALLITRSEKGMTLIDNNGKLDIPTRAKEVFDITGAGDTVIATLSLATASAVDWSSSAQLANVAAGIVVGKMGTSTVTTHEISVAMSSD